MKWIIITLILLMIIIGSIVFYMYSGENYNQDLKVYASFTTIPERLENLEPTIKSLVNQSYPIQKIFVNIPYGKSKRSGKEYYVPKYLSKYKQVEVTRGKDLGPGTKILGSLHKIPQDGYVLVVDDDTIYLKQMLRKLVKNFNVKEYDATGYTNNGGVNELCGFVGYLVKRNILNGLYKYFENIPDICYYVDDVWITDYIRRNNYKIKEYIWGILNRNWLYSASIYITLPNNNNALSTSKNKENGIKLLPTNIKNRNCQKKLYINKTT